MMKYSLIIVIVIFGCNKPENPKSDTTILEFNQKAGDSFQKNFDSYDLGSESDLNKCILQKGVANYLDDLNNWKLTVIDSFYIRGYNFDDLGIHFSFVAKKNGEHYFIYLPHLTDYLIHNLYFDEYYDYEDNGEITLKDSVNLSISKINSKMLDNFLSKEVFGSGDPYNQYTQTERLFGEFFPFFREEILLHVFLEELKKEPKENQEYIMKVVNPITSRTAVITKGAFDYRMYRLGPFGWILIDYFLEDSNSINVDIYFVARKHSFNLGYETEKRKYNECFEKYGQQ